MVENNAHLSMVPLANLFVWLHKQGHLSGMINRMVDAENLISDVEHRTRGIHSYVGNKTRPNSPAKWYNHKKLNGKKLKSITETYLSIDIKFHRKDKFAQDWKNGEHAYLNLISGEVKTF